MATYLSVRFVRFAHRATAGVTGQPNMSYPGQMLEEKTSTRTEVEVTSTALAGASRPAKPADEGLTHAIVEAVGDGNICIAIGSDPTATQTGILLQPGVQYQPILVPDGHRISAIAHILGGE